MERLKGPDNQVETYDASQTVEIVMIGGGVYEAILPLTVEEESWTSEHERFIIALDAYDRIVASEATLPSYAELRRRITIETGLSWAVAALAIEFRGQYHLSDLHS